MEETFKIQIEPIEINGETFRTVSAVACLILEKLAAVSAAAKSIEP